MAIHNSTPEAVSEASTATPAERAGDTVVVDGSLAEQARDMADPSVEAVRAARQANYIAFLFRTPFALDAYELGYATGVREDYTLQQDRFPNLDVPVFMLDNDFHDPNLDRWVEIFEHYEPEVGIIGDAYTRDQAREYVRVASEIRDEVPDTEFIIVPKCRCFDLLPDWVVLGYFEGGKNSEGQAEMHPMDFSDFHDWRGRRVHVLGGSPPKQMEVIDALTRPTVFDDPPANIVGTDYNGFYGTATQYGDYWTRNGWRNPEEEGEKRGISRRRWEKKGYIRRRRGADPHEYTLREKTKIGLHEAKRFWSERGIWPDTTPDEAFGKAVMEPEMPVFGDGSHFGYEEEGLWRVSFEAREDRLFGEDDGEHVLVRYSDGEVRAYRSERARAFAEHKAGVLRDHGEPERVMVGNPAE